MEKNIVKNLKTKEDLKSAILSYCELTPRINSVVDIRHNEMQEYIDNLNSGIKFHFLTGFSGVGKSEILKLTPAFLDNSLFFCFDCFNSACIDDVIFSLYRYFTTIKSVKIQHLVKKTFSQTRSIDERIFDLLKDFPMNLIIAFDSFEHFINKNTDRLPHEISKFLDFLSEQDNIKIVTGSQVAPFEIMKKHPFSKNLRLDTLNFNQFLELKKAMNVQEGNVSLEQIFDETLGVSRNIRNFFKAIKDEDSLEFFKRATSQKIDFNEYVIYQLAGKLSQKEADVLYYLSSIRHPVTKDTIDSIIPDECKNTFEEFLKSSFVYSFEGHLYVKDYFAKQISSKVSKAQKEKVHTALSTFYGKEIPLKHFERHIKLSRTTLRNEFAYHLKLSEHKKSNEITLRASTLNSDVILYQESKTIPFKEDASAPKSKKNLSEEVMKKADNIAVQNISAHNIQTEVVGVEFSEEERKLLYEEAKELQKVDDDKLPKDKRKKTIIDEIPIEIDYKKSKIIDNTDYYKFLEDALDQEASKQYDKARELYQKAQKVCKIKDKELYIHSKIANCYTKLKKRQEAMQSLKSAYMLAKELNDDKKLAYVLLNIAKTLHSFGEYKLAEQHYNDFLDMNILKELPKGQILFALLGLGDLYIDSNQESNALQVYETALKQAGVNHPVLNEVYFKIALTFDNMGNMQKAKEFYERGSKEILTKDSYDKYYSESCSNLGLILVDEGDYSNAISLLSKAYETDKEAGELEAMLQSVSKLADTYFDLKDYKMAQKFYYEKLKAAKELNTPYLLASAYLDVGDVYMRINNLSKALRAFILAKKSIGNEISTDSKVKIERRIDFIKSKIDKKEFEAIIGHS